MAQESTQPQARNKVDAKEDLVFLTSGAKEKLSKTIVGASETAYKMLHPFDKEARDQATEKAKELKREVSVKQAGIRATAHQQAEQERMGHANLLEAHLCRTPTTEAGRELQERGVPGLHHHMRPSSEQPSQVQKVVANERGISEESYSSGSSSSSSDGSNRAGIAPTAADYRSA